jgi:hypothetical protein
MMGTPGNPKEMTTSEMVRYLGERERERDRNQTAALDDLTVALRDALNVLGKRAVDSTITVSWLSVERVVSGLHVERMGAVFDPPPGAELRDLWYWEAQRLKAEVSALRTEVARLRGGGDGGLHHG